MKGLMKRFMKQFRYGEKGFTLVELLVVIAIVGVIAAVVVPNVGRFIGRGRTEAYAAEIHNVQTATMALLAESTAGVLDAASCGVAQSDMDLVTTDTGALALSTFLTGLNADGTVKLGCTYTFLSDGTVQQTVP